MNWEVTTPKSGDMIRVKAGSIYHYGIFVSEDEVIQFGLAPVARPLTKDCEVEVCATAIEDFLCGGFVEVAFPDKKESKKRKKPEETVTLAKKRLGEKGYHILYNNCEHFAYECAYGERYCSQAEDVRKLFRAFPVLDVYIAPLPEGEIGEAYPKERAKEIENCQNERVKREKYFVWKLLEYALERSFGKKMKKLSFSKTKNGKWKTDCGMEFSLSHSEGALCVALSRKPVGVDIEPIALPKTEKILDKIFTQSELTVYNALHTDEEKAEYFSYKWTEKEAAFKSLDLPAFLPALSHLGEVKTLSQTVCVQGKLYALSIAGESADKIKLRENIILQ